MEVYVVQVRYDDGTVWATTMMEHQILDAVGMSDCSGCEYQVYMQEGFGKLVPLDRIQNDHAPFNYHTFVRSDTGEVIFEGFSPEH